jgi:hypothetical protein
MNRKSLNVNNFLAGLVLGIIVLFLTFFIIYNANWSLGDQAQFLTTTALHKILSIHKYVIPSLGRFFPLGLMDYNLLLFFHNGNTATAHFILNAFSFLVFILVSLILFYKIIFTESKNKQFIWLLVCTILFLISRVYSVFLDLIFPERIVVTLLVLFILSTYQFKKTDRWIYGILSLILAVYLVYCKEPLFGSIIIFALSDLIFNYRNLPKNYKIFLYLLIVNSLIFITLYYFLVFRFIVSVYSSNHGEINVLDIILRMIWSQKIIILAVILFIPRIYSIIFKKDVFHLFFDGLLFSGLAYFVACLILKLNFTYYYLPSVILITPAIVYWLLYYIKIKWTLIIMIVFALFYSYKLIAIIKESQNNRITIYPAMREIAQYKQRGYQLIWYSPDGLDISTWNGVKRDWKKWSSQDYIAFIIKDEKFHFTIENKIDSIKNKVVILYPEENNLIDRVQQSFKLEISKYSLDTLTQVAGITFLTNKKNLDR